MYNDKEKEEEPQGESTHPYPDYPVSSSPGGTSRKQYRDPTKNYNLSFENETNAQFGRAGRLMGGWVNGCSVYCVPK